MDYIWYTDPQQETPTGICPRCGGEVYGPEKDCRTCRLAGKNEAGEEVEES